MTNEQRKMLELSIKKDILYLTIFALTAGAAMQTPQGAGEDALCPSRIKTAKGAVRLMASGLAGVLRKSYLYVRCME